MKLSNHTRSLILGLLVMLMIGGCSDDEGSAPGVLAVSLTDGPACGFDEVNVTVSNVRVHQSGSADAKGGGWADITLNPPRKINLLDLNDPTQPNFALESLGETPLAAGHYTQLRLGLVGNTGNQPLANSVVLSNLGNCARYAERHSNGDQVDSSVRSGSRPTDGFVARL